MNTNRDILRMRHVHQHGVTLPQGYATEDYKKAWDNCKKGFDALAGAVLVGGLVQALLLSLKARDKNGQPQPMRIAADTLVAWLNDEKACCPPSPMVSPDFVCHSPLECYAAGLIALNNVHDAMAIQAEALRYLSQAKLVAGAFKG
jgi:hypothetical protein